MLESEVLVQGKSSLESSFCKVFGRICIAFADSNIDIPTS